MNTITKIKNFSLNLFKKNDNKGKSLSDQKVRPNANKSPQKESGEFALEERYGTWHMFV